MAALIHDVPVGEPTYCKLKHVVNPQLRAKLDSLKNVIAALSLCQTQHDKLLSESKLLHIMIYKRNGQLRKEKSLQLLKRVRSCLRRAFIFNKLFRISSDLNKDVQSALADMQGKGFGYIPAQQTWSYLLYLQLMYTKYLEATMTYCTVAFEHLSCQLATGMLIPQMLVFMGIVARIWMLSKTIAERMGVFYNQIQPVREYIEPTQSDWKTPDVPERLGLDVPADSLISSEHERFSLPVKNSQREQETTGQLNAALKHVLKEEDLGEPVAKKRKHSDDFSDKKIRKKSRTVDIKPHYIKKKKKTKIKKNSELLNEVKVENPTNPDLSQPVLPPKLSKQKKKKKKKEDLKTLKGVRIITEMIQDVDKNSSVLQLNTALSTNGNRSSESKMATCNTETVSQCKKNQSAITLKKKKKRKKKADMLHKSDRTQVSKSLVKKKQNKTKCENSQREQKKAKSEDVHKNQKKAKSEDVYKNQKKAKSQNFQKKQKHINETVSLSGDIKKKKAERERKGKKKKKKQKVKMPK